MPSTPVKKRKKSSLKSTAQADYASAFFDPALPTFLDHKASADVVATPIPKSYASATAKPQWLKDLADEHPLLKLAEQNIEETLRISVSDKLIGDRAVKMSMFVAERLGKHKYSTRQEITGANGQNLIPREEVEARIIHLRSKPV